MFRPLLIRLLAVGVGATVMISCAPSISSPPTSSAPTEGDRQSSSRADKQPTSERKTDRNRENPLLGTWRAKPGQVLSPYVICEEFIFEESASFCDGSGTAATYEVRDGEVVVYEDTFVQVVKIDGPNEVSMNFPGGYSLELERVR